LFHISTSKRKKKQKRKVRCGGERLRAGRGKRGAKERRLRRLKEKVTSPFPPRSGVWKYGKPYRFTTFPHPSAPPFFPSDFLSKKRILFVIFRYDI
jgi:hypothetical protein